LEGWIKETIARGITDPSVFVSIEELEGDASTRRYFRVTIRGEEGTPDFTVVMMRYPDSHVVEGQLLFEHVHRFLEMGGVKVPRIYLHLPEGNLLFLEDAGDKTLESQVNEEGFCEKTLSLYELALEEMVKIQSKCTALLDPGSVPARLSFDRDKFMEEMNFFARWGIKNIFPEDGERLSESFLKLVEPVILEITSLPRFLAHRDYHSRNIMVVGGGDIRILDFQDARMGTIFYDLASLLLDSYVTIPDGKRDRLAVTYMEIAAGERLPVGRSRDEFLVNLWKTAIQRNLKALGTFFFMLFGRKNQRYRDSIPTTIEHLKKNPVLEEDFPELAGFIIPLLEKMREELEKNG